MWETLLLAVPVEAPDGPSFFFFSPFTDCFGRDAILNHRWLLRAELCTQEGKPKTLLGFEPEPYFYCMYFFAMCLGSHLHLYLPYTFGIIF